MIIRRIVICSRPVSACLQNARTFSNHKIAPRIAVVGSGPAGMFTCTSLLRKSPAHIDVFEYSPVPYGLVRYGVAPDHQEVKNCINGFDKLFVNHSDRIKLFCNVKVGQDVAFDELVSNYDAIVLAYGSYRQRKLQTPGDKSTNVVSGSDFVAWYNGVPNSKAPLLDNSEAVIIGNGNVALDCARIISLGVLGKLNETDVPLERLKLLENAAINRIKIVGRRGPLDVSFTIKELREQFRVEGWQSYIEAAAREELEPEKWPAGIERKHQRLFELLRKHVLGSGPTDDKQCEFLFRRVSKEIKADENGRVKELIVENTRTKQREAFPCGLLIYCLGYESMVLDGVPKNDKVTCILRKRVNMSCFEGTIAMSDYWRVSMPSACSTRVYATGWCAHGPQGVIVQTQQQSAAVAETISTDLEQIQLQEQKPGVADLLKSRSVRYISWEKWKQIDEAEKERGKLQGKVREKFTAFDQFVSDKSPVN
ncbi:hypothetical protein WR25_25975 [Diploscapter pachys]|uniref:NADPH:adrenodoxin oxidoreductase, mitochondrial n=1 Tax=Diploscapter pachys TaxID=2018661 RepID=A0A2A2L408_9BILA|nr:hypothetical protein WR25_25975 [Diploscapter pachys]